MRHRAAWRALPQLLDATLEPACERAARAHLARCTRCARRLAELELCDDLVAELPLGVVPLVMSAAGERRLAGLARWAFRPPAVPSPWAPLDGLAVAAAAAALAGVVALVGAQSWLPAPEPVPSGITQVAYVMPAPGLH